MIRRGHLAALASALVVALLGTVGLTVPVGAQTAQASSAKVVVIVGPVASLTPYYRQLAAAAIAAARDTGAQVVSLESPDATWPAVKSALSGASIVVYLGHGWGDPSPYRATLDPSLQDGLGLNPVGGHGDVAHQYFGERYLASVHLAPGAMVILSHLCYASGNPEPGGPDPTLQTAETRVDNFAAGWLAAGAVAVVAEGHLGPAYYVSGLLAGRQTIEELWRHSPSRHGNDTAFASSRTPGATATIDPDAPGRGYFRSLVESGGTGHRIDGLPASPTPHSRVEASGIAVDATQPSLASEGVRVGIPAVAGSTVPGGTLDLRLPYVAPPGVRLPVGLRLGVEWDPITLGPSAWPPGPGAPTSSTGPTLNAGPTTATEPAAPPTQPAQPTASTGTAAAMEPTATTAPASSGADWPAASPVASPALPQVGMDSPGSAAATAGSVAPDSRGLPAAPQSATSDAPVVDLIAPEAGGLVTTVRAIVGQSTVDATVPVAPHPGLYRLQITLHRPGGTPLAAADQDLVPALIVRVTAVVSATYGALAHVPAPAGGMLTLDVRVANTGSLPWTAVPAGGITTTGSTPAPLPQLTGTWVALGATDAGPDTPAVATTVADLAPGDSAVLQLPLVVPERAGDYLLVLDVDTPAYGSLAAAGVPVGTVVVTVK